MKKLGAGLLLSLALACGGAGVGPDQPEPDGVVQIVVHNDSDEPTTVEVSRVEHGLTAGMGLVTILEFEVPPGGRAERWKEDTLFGDDWRTVWQLQQGPDEVLDHTSERLLAGQVATWTVVENLVDSELAIEER